MQIIIQQLPELNIETHLMQQIKLSNKILVGTHHKAGTVWLQSIFRNICNEYSLEYFNGKQAKLPDSFDVFLQFHSQFDLGSFHNDYRGVHIIRDPRDIIISGYFYHKIANEKWLHEPSTKYGGKTYQEKINSFKSLDDQILFEMENSGFRNINKILNWNYTNPLFYEIKYEELIQDSKMKLFKAIFEFLNFPQQNIPTLLAISFNKSIFSGKLKQSDHIRSGKSKQWKNHFKTVHRNRFIELFGDALIRLGYETNNDW